MHTYIAIYRGKRIEVKAADSYRAQLEAAKIFRAKKSYDVTVAIVRREDGAEVVHSTASLG